MSGTPAANHYELLGLPAKASTEACHAAWRARVSATHPDLATDRADEIARTAAAARLNAAWATLSDPVRRADYDLTIARLSEPAPIQPPNNPAYSANYANNTAYTAAPAPSTQHWSMPSAAALQGLGLGSFALAGAFLTSLATLPFALPVAVGAIVLGVAGLAVSALSPETVWA